MLEGIQGDLDYIRVMMRPSRTFDLLKASRNFGSVFLESNEIKSKSESLATSALIQGWYSRQLCCHYCRALAWTYEGDPEETAEYLYTNYGPDAAHRSTRLCVNIIGFLCQIFDGQTEATI